jgi:cytochrome P450
MLLDMPKNPAGEIMQLSQQYGGIYSLKMARQRYVVIADAQIAEELLVTRAAKTSSREASYIASKTLWTGMGVITSPQNDSWRKHRQIIQRALQSQGVDRAADVIQNPLARLCDKLVSRAVDEKELQLIFAEYSLENFLLMLLGLNHDMLPESLFRQILSMMNEMLYVDKH